MAKSVGKHLEDDLYNSFSDKTFTHRIRDVQMYAGSTSVADYITFYNSDNSDKQYLFLFELKTSKGISISVSTKYNDKGELTSWGRLNWQQMQMMIKENAKSGNIIVGYIMEFRKADKCYFVDIDTMIDFLIDPSRDRKSVPVEFLDDKGLLLNRELKSSVWTVSEQEIILDEVGKDYTGNEVVGIVKDKLPNRNDSSIKSKFYQLKKSKKVKPVTQYIHYHYPVENLDRIVEYINNK